MIKLQRELSEVVDYQKYSKYIQYDEKNRPVMLSIETVNICNNDCIICAYSEMNRKKNVMTLEVFKKVLIDYSSMGGGVFTLTPVVGDIFLDHLLYERYKMIEKYPLILQPSFTTNAIKSIHINDDNLKYILKNTKTIHISIYGMDPEEYRLMTKRDEYNLLITSIKRIIFLVDDIKKIKLGFRSLKEYTDESYSTWILDNFSCSLPYGYTNTYGNWGVLNTNTALPFSAKWIDNNDDKKQCLLPLVSYQVFVDGKVSFCPCDDFENDEELNIGSIIEDTLLNICNSDRVINLWDFKNNIPNFCKKCTFYMPIEAIKNNEYLFSDPQKFFGE